MDIYESPSWDYQIFGRDDFTVGSHHTQIRLELLEYCKKRFVGEIDRLEDGLIGKNSVVLKDDKVHQAYRLMIGDDSEVQL